MKRRERIETERLAEVASTGYVLARNAWVFGYATEELGVKRLYALCHREQGASARVLEKCGFRNEGEREVVFPNLGDGSELQRSLAVAARLRRRTVEA